MKNILVLDSSIMIQKIIKLAFPENEYNLLFSGTYPVSENIPDDLEYIFITADLPGEKDGYDVGAELRKKYNCPVLIMVPKFVNFNEEKFSKYNLDGNLEKPFTSEILKDAVAKLQHIESKIENEETKPEELNDINSLSDSELGDLSDEEFMISDEDLAGISDEDLKDIDFDDDILEDINETEEVNVSENNEDVETAELEEPLNEDLVMPSETEENDDFSKPIVDLNEEIEFQDEIEEEVLGNDFEGQSDELDDVSFDEEIGSDLEAIEFEDNEEVILEEEAMEEVSSDGDTVEAETEAEAVVEPEMEPIVAEEKIEESAVVEDELKNEMDDVEFDVKEEPQTVQLDEYQLSESEIPDEEPVPFEVGDVENYDGIEEIVEEIEDDIPMVELEEDEVEEKVESADEEGITIGLSKDESDVEIMGAPSGMVPPKIESNISDDEKLEVHEEPVFENEEAVEPVGVSEIMEDEEIITAPSGIAPAIKDGKIEIDPNDIDKIALKVAELISDKVLRQVAWEVIPAVAEEVVKNRIKELEEEVD